MIKVSIKIFLNLNTMGNYIVCSKELGAIHTKKIKLLDKIKRAKNYFLSYLMNTKSKIMMMMMMIRHSPSQSERNDRG
jgi:hypothetical protein